LARYPDGPASCCGCRADGLEKRALLEAKADALLRLMAAVTFYQVRALHAAAGGKGAA
jgi:hypothetical protein